MKHYSYEQWEKYVKDELDENVRGDYDEHLYNCDPCLELYLQVVEEQSNDLPALSDEDEFANLIMTKIQDKKKETPFYQKTLFHYGVAVAMTITLMSTGVFQSITKYVDRVQSPVVQREPSVTEGLVNKTFAWMDRVEIKNREANQN